MRNTGEAQDASDAGPPAPQPQQVAVDVARSWSIAFDDETHALATFALAQSVDGKWSAEVQGGRGPQQLTITLKADGGKLTGSIAGGRGGEVEIQDGTISGSAIKFKSVQQGRGGQVTMNWAGTVKGDEIAFTRTPEGGQAVEFTAKRQK